MGLEQKQKLPKWNFMERSILRFALTFSMLGFGYSSNSDSKKNVPSETLLKVHLGALPNILKINFVENETLLINFGALIKHFPG